MKLNWRRIVCIVLCAELLFIYWNSVSVLQSKKQQSVYPAIAKQTPPPLTRMKSPKPKPSAQPIDPAAKEAS